jgi:hypothetical protein
MHPVNGLEFDHVIAASADDKFIPPDRAMKSGRDAVVALCRPDEAAKLGGGSAGRRVPGDEPVPVVVPSCGHERIRPLQLRLLVEVDPRVAVEEV